jgi:Tfp pilus assembly protein PilX
MKRILRDERGMALAVAIFALVVVGALVAGAFFAGTQEQRVGENQRRVQASFGVAEAGAQERVLSWDPATMNKRNQIRDSVVIGPTPCASGTARGATATSSVESLSDRRRARQTVPRALSPAAAARQRSA